MSGLPRYEAALGAVLSLARVPLEVELVELARGDRRVLARDIAADRDLPPFNRAMMDGYALRHADLRPGVSLPVHAVIPAGAEHVAPVPRETCVRVATGAPVPRELDTVIPHEWTDRGNPVSFTSSSMDQAEVGHSIHPRGADARAGATLITGGTMLGPHHLGIAAAVGCAAVAAYRQPKVMILTSGDEVVSPATARAQIANHQIRNSNGPMLASAVMRFGAASASHKHVQDERDATRRALQQAIGSHDLVLTVGGVSVGERDHFPAAYEACGVATVLAGAAIQPGQPVRAGRVEGAAVVIGLPGNPVSALACAHLFVWPLLRAMQGLVSQLAPRNDAPAPPYTSVLPWETRRLAAPVKPNARRQAFRPAMLGMDGTIVVPPWAGSGDLAHTACTHGLAALPVQANRVEPGTFVPFLPWAS